ncbi:MAG TPA: ABC transporter ATP-binding protein [Gammaproteobacteria bacterium]|nr:ABC transporter ATP-binding protein [Gammaproteobacteria bacterium]
METVADDVPALEFSGVRKAYGARRVLDGIDLRVHSGSLFGLVGINGAGKTTLIKSMLDFQALDEGVIRVFGEDHRQPRARRHLAFLPERFSPPHYLRGADFLRYMAQLHEVRQDEEEVAGLLARLDLEPAALDLSVRRFSKGMTQKLGLMGCLLSGRRLLVLDEPMSGLDPKARARVKGLLRDLCKAGRTVFLTTHLLHDVDALCDRFAILHGGRLVFQGSPRECRACYGTEDLEQAYLKAIGG